ncbi:MAG TPA: amino acid permease [Terriglobales bacterium]|nr:amino acid permease [Terriglobales bacterium]
MGLTSATMLVMGSMIGSGIFIVSAEIAREVQSPALLIGAWVITGIMTIIGGLAYGELSAMMPRAGGQYVFLRESLGSLWAFLFGWTYFLVIQCGTIAAVGVAMGKFLGVFFPSVSSTHWLSFHYKVPPIHVGPMVLGNMDVGLNTQNLVAILSIILLSVINVYGVKLGALVQVVFTFAKTAALLGLIVFGYFLGKNATAIMANFSSGHFWHNAGLGTLHQIPVGLAGATATVGALTILAVAQVGSLFSADAWNSVTFTAAEVKNPNRNLPLSLVIGTGAVILLYILANFVYLCALPLAGDPHGTTLLSRGIQYATEDRVATAVMQQMFGGIGASLIAVAILVSTFGCNNGLILSGARCYYAMARDGLFFRQVGKLHPKYKTPHVSLAVQAIWASALCLSGTYGQLLDYTMFSQLAFYVLTFLGLFILRRTRPDAPRPYKALGYPFLPALYILMAVFIDVVWLRYKPQYTWPGLIIVLLGIPVYFWWSRGAQAQQARQT